MLYIAIFIVVVIALDLIDELRNPPKTNELTPDYEVIRKDLAQKNNETLDS